MNHNQIPTVAELIGELAEFWADGDLDLSDELSDLTPAEWRAVVAAAMAHRCIRCGETECCACSDDDRASLARLFAR